MILLFPLVFLSKVFFFALGHVIIILECIGPGHSFNCPDHMITLLPAVFNLQRLFFFAYLSKKSCDL